MNPLLSELPLDEDTPFEEACRLIDEAIEKHETCIMSLKSQRNRFAPISRLPPEIICKIFSLVQKENPSYWPRLRWIKVSHVTRYWRNVALESPSLWADLPMGKPPVVEEMLRRSKDASLIIECDLRINADKIKPGLELALRHSARAKGISFKSIDSIQWDQLQKQLPESAPRLEYLTLEGFKNMHTMPNYFAQKTMSIPENVLRETGRLRDVELLNFKVDWNAHAHILRSLTHLKLHNISHDSRPTTKQFANILKGMPDVEFLDLQNVLPVQTGEQVPWTSDQIRLASLQTLDVHATHVELESFFSWVALPPTATVKIVFNETNASFRSGSGMDFSGVFSRLSQAYTPKFRTITMRTVGVDDGIQLKLYTNTLTDDEMIAQSMYRPKFIPTLTLELLYGTWSAAHLIFSKFISGVFSGALRLRHVEAVYLEHDFGLMDAKTVGNTFGRLPRVCSVVADHVLSVPLIGALELSSRAKGTDPTIVDKKPTVYFPRLSSICLHCVTFHKDSKDGLTIENLQDCLIQRCKSKSGAKIEQVIFLSCRRLGEEDVDLIEESLEDFDVTVDWDCEESFTDSEEEDDDDVDSTDSEDEDDSADHEW